MNHQTDDRLRYAGILRHVAEAVILLLVALSPYPFGGVEPSWTFGLLLGVAVLVGLWLAHVVLTREVTFRWDAISLGLFGLVVFTAFQTVPLPESVVGVLSPTRLEYHHSFRPAQEERLPGEPAASARPSMLPLTIDASRTRDSLILFAAVFLVYAIARNFVFTRDSAQRLAWVAFANGILLATLALMQFFSSPRTVVYWSFPTQGGVFGPFVCKNHYPYYLSFCIGLGLALLLQDWQKQDRDSPYCTSRRGWGDAFSHALERLRSPKSVFLLGGLGLMLASVPFSLSRGGLLAVFGAGALTFLVSRCARPLDGEGTRRSGGSLIVLFLLSIVVGLGAWFGWKPVEQRLDTLWQGSQVASGDRIPLWKDLATAIPKFPLVGAGAGSTIHLEVLTRARKDIAFMYYVNAHNDYLEALLEGGIIRLGLTLLIVFGALSATALGYIRFSHRMGGPWLLGAFFGLAEVSIHSAVDFGMHIPAVALIATVTAAFAMGTREDLVTTKERRRNRSRRRSRSVDAPKGSHERGEGNSEPLAPLATSPGSKEPSPSMRLSGSLAITVLACALLATSFLLLQAWKSWMVARWGNYAVAAAVDFDNPERLKLAADRIESATRVRPDDPTLWNDLSGARLADALDRANRAAGAAAGPAATYFLAPETPPPELIESHVVPALRAARKARNLCPTLPGPQLRLGSLSAAFASSDAPEQYYERAKQAAPSDAEIRYLSGADALARGDRKSAWSSWKEALSRSRSVLGLILRATSKPLPPDGLSLPVEELRSEVLPDDPGLWLLAADLMFPDASVAPPERAVLLRAANARYAAGPPPTDPGDWQAWGQACEELRDWTAALNVWRRAFEANPNSAALRDRLALRLEADEQYAEAQAHLEWLWTRAPERLDLRDRRDGVDHALKLLKEIDGN